MKIAMNDTVIEGAKQLDITGAKHIEVAISEDGRTLWVNVDEVNLLRASKTTNITVDNRGSEKSPSADHQDSGQT